MAAAWVVVAAVVGVLVGRMIRARDRQVPPAQDVAPAPAPAPEPRPTRQVPGRSRQRRG